jgi:alkylhydroperoxidase family enzyme
MMSRIEKIPRDNWAPELAAAFGNQEATELELGLTRMLAHKPQAAAALLGFRAALGLSRELPSRLVELVRLRIAFHNQCRSCMAIRYNDESGQSLDESAVCSLEKPMEAPNLGDEERAALAYADLFATDHLAINDSTYADLRRYFTEAQIVELGLICAFCVGVGRLGATWDMVEELPKDYQDHGERVAPWHAKAVETHG